MCQAVHFSPKSLGTHEQVLASYLSSQVTLLSPEISSDQCQHDVRWRSHPIPQMLPSPACCLEDLTGSQGSGSCMLSCSSGGLLPAPGGTFPYSLQRLNHRLKCSGASFRESLIYPKLPEGRGSSTFHPIPVAPTFLDCMTLLDPFSVDSGPPSVDMHF